MLSHRPVIDVSPAGRLVSAIQARTPHEETQAPPEADKAKAVLKRFATATI